tara:strand:+ start:2746 stop:2880 length:135 start_codon:yes stop_codon:yes gene_type:complete
MDNKKPYLSSWEWQVQKAKNNRRLGFVVGVLFTLLVIYILGELL